MNITDALSAWAERIPDAPALLTDKMSLSYAELDRAVSWAARHFKESGFLPGDTVAIFLSNQTAQLVTCLALARLGVGQISFHTSDPPRLQQELARRLGVVATVTDQPKKVATKTPLVARPSIGARRIKSLKPIEFEAVRRDDLPFLYLNTSGTSTGVPKIGLMTHEIARRRLRHLVIAGPGTRFLSPIKLSFTGATQNALRCLMTGSCFALQENARSAQETVDFVLKHRINYLYGVPLHAADFLKHAEKDTVLFPDLDVLQVGAGLLPERLRREIRKRVTPNLHIHYGTAEVGIIAIATPEVVGNVPGVVGRILPGVETEVIDDEGRPMPPGDAGNLRVKSDAMIDGYIDAAAETKAAFRDGWFHPGDVVECTAAGELIFHGRADDLMILDGINIYPAEIESALLEHPAVAEAAAFPIRSPARGDVPAAAVALVAEVSTEALLAHCRSLLGTHAPSRLMEVPKLPRNPSGKVLKKELEEMYRDQRRRHLRVRLS